MIMIGTIFVNYPPWKERVHFLCIFSAHDHSPIPLQIKSGINRRIKYLYNLDGLDVSEEALNARTYYREAVLKELHVVYRKTMQIVDYAARLGELMMLREIFEVVFPFRVLCHQSGMLGHAK